MLILVTIVGGLIVVVGAVGLVAPTRFVAFARQWQSTFHLYLAAAIRLVVGSALYIAHRNRERPSSCASSGSLPSWAASQCLSSVSLGSGDLPIGHRRSRRWPFGHGRRSPGPSDCS